MDKLGQLPPKPRRAQTIPSYPRCLAALAMAAAMTTGCKPEVALAGDVAPAFAPDAAAVTTGRTEPEVALAGDVAPAFAPDAATKTAAPKPPPPASTEVMLGGEAPAPFEGDKH